ncbi:NUDIX hydrolase [Candidatus Leptofilum sp.]|uniref:NUDIX hydrolase n=1 Tax=Candidatus Leptofilum sp. TaxID=3241576 RepID=UPI003B58D726
MIKKGASKLLWQQEDSWRLRLDTLQLPNGRTVQKAAVAHPGAVVLVPIHSPAGEPPSTNGPEILMLRQYRHALNQTILELPAGTRGWDEDWLLCAQRELREETGHRAEKFTPLGQIWPAPGISDELMQLYLAESLSPAPLLGDEDELIELTPMPLTELVEMCWNGQLQDAKSIVGILRAARFLNH